MLELAYVLDGISNKWGAYAGVITRMNRPEEDFSTEGKPEWQLLNQPADNYIFKGKLVPAKQTTKIWGETSPPPPRIKTL